MLTKFSAILWLPLLAAAAAARTKRAPPRRRFRIILRAGNIWAAGPDRAAFWLHRPLGAALSNEPTSQRPVSLRLSAVTVAATLVFGLPRPARAQNDLTYEYENYREAGGRITVQTNGAQVEQDLTSVLHFKLGGVMDSITGATPTGAPAPAGSNQVPLAQITDRRKAWDTDLSDQIGPVNISAGYSRSLEHDYVSNGWSLNTVTDFNQKNTSLVVGAAGTDNDVEVFFEPAWFKKRTNDFLVGVNQVLDPNTTVSFDLTWSRALGFLNEPYKAVVAYVQVLPGVFYPAGYPENRPGERRKGIALASIDHNFPSLHGMIEASLRLTHDTWDITSGTAEFAWFQRLGGRFILRPMVRFYDQSAASFYTYQLNPAIAPTTIPTGQGPFYAFDARLSRFYSLDSGLKAIWKATDAVQLDVGIEAYGQRGTDGVTPQTAYYRATITRAGLKYSW